MQKEIYSEQDLSGFHRSTRWRIRKRGYLTIDYHIKKMNPVPVTEAQGIEFIRIAKIVVGKYFMQHAIFDNRFQEDIIQDCTLRMLELSGKSEEFNFLYTIALNVTKTACRKYRLFNNLEWQEVMPER